jgi:hypothetical protein
MALYRKAIYDGHRTPVGGGKLDPQQGDLMTSYVKHLSLAFGLAVLGVAIALGGIYLGEMDDAPGASVAGIVLMVVAVVFAVRIARRKT